MWFREISRKQKTKVFSFFWENWWVLTFIFLSLSLCFQSLYYKNSVTSDLKNKISHLNQIKEAAIQERKELLVHLQSQNDPDWIELILKERLGLIEEGETKVIFPY